MPTRRAVIGSMLGAYASFGCGWAAVKGLPNAKIIKGNPPVIDFGDGLKVPCDKSAFLTLWENKSVWLTFGFGTSALPRMAKSRAVYHAMGAMRYLLLTLAFADERLDQVNGCGWRQKVEKPSNYVMGDLDLPGHASRALDDFFLGAGNVGTDTFWDQSNAGDPADPHAGPSSGDMNALPSMSLKSVNAFCCYVVMKKDLSLSDVRLRARILKI